MARLSETATGRHPQPTDRLRVPELQSACPHQRAGKCGAAAALRRRRGADLKGAQRPRPRHAGRRRSGRSRAQHAQPALRRTTATRRPGPGADQPACRAAGRRAHRQSRYAHLARDHGNHPQAQSRAGRHGDRRDPRGRHRRLCRPHDRHARRTRSLSDEHQVAVAAPDARHRRQRRRAGGRPAPRSRTPTRAFAWPSCR